MSNSTPQIAICPWCKENASIKYYNKTGWLIGCTNDKCEIQPNFWADDEQHALEVWNKR